MFKGRTREQKRALARELTDAFVRVAGGKPESVTIVLKDVDKEDWAVAGALMADKYPD
jgi:4-oxalocrotonate tautomerase